MSHLGLMVQLDLEDSNAARLKVAGDLAQMFGSRVIGIAAGDQVPGLYFAEGAFAADLFEQERQRIKSRMEQVEREFRAALASRASSVEWRAAEALPADFIARQARAADLIVAGLRPEAGALAPVTSLDVGDLLLQAGRPVLVVPPDASGLKAKSVLIGWKDTREARRAVLDALPLLRRADAIYVAQILDGPEDKAAVQAALADVVGWLSLHDIKATATTRPASGHRGQLGTLASELGADLIVAGAYGHSRLREWAWGGVTLDLLTRTKCCVLLSH